MKRFTFRVAEGRGVRAWLIFQAVVVEIAVERLSHREAGTVKARFYSICLESQNFRCLFRGKFFEVPQHHDRPITRRKLQNHPVQHGSQFACEQAALGCIGGIGDFA